MGTGLGTERILSSVVIFLWTSPHKCLWHPKGFSTTQTLALFVFWKKLSVAWSDRSLFFLKEVESGMYSFDYSAGGSQCWPILRMIRSTAFHRSIENSRSRTAQQVSSEGFSLSVIEHLRGRSRCCEIVTAALSFLSTSHIKHGKPVQQLHRHVVVSTGVIWKRGRVLTWLSIKDRSSTTFVVILCNFVHTCERA